MLGWLRKISLLKTGEGQGRRTFLSKSVAVHLVDLGLFQAQLDVLLREQLRLLLGNGTRDGVLLPLTQDLVLKLQKEAPELLSQGLGVLIHTKMKGWVGPVQSKYLLLHCLQALVQLVLG